MNGEHFHFIVYNQYDCFECSVVAMFLNVIILLSILDFEKRNLTFWSVGLLTVLGAALSTGNHTHRP